MHMRRMIGLLILLPLLVGNKSPCPEPHPPRIEDCPFEVDPNLVVGGLLGWVRVELGQDLVHTRTWCDPQGDPARAEIVSAPEGVQIVDRPRISSYTLIWTPTQVGVYALVVRVTDDPPAGQPKSTTGTVLVEVVPRGQRSAPRGCGSPPR